VDLARKIGKLELLPDGNPERQRLAGLEQQLAELQKKENILLERSQAPPPPPGDQPHLYNNVTVYMPGYKDLRAYTELKKTITTRKQLKNMLKQCGYALMAPVESRPSEILMCPDTCPEPFDVDTVPLANDSKVAVVLHRAPPILHDMDAAIKATSNKAGELGGFKDNLVAEQENVAAAWALEQIKHEPGAKLFCFKQVSWGTRGVQVAVELDGAAYSDSSFIVVERKQELTYEYAEQFCYKLDKLREFIKLQAPNTSVMYGKKLVGYLMAGSWCDNADEQAAVRQVLQQSGIQAVLPCGTGYEPTWGCNPPKRDDATSAERYITKLERRRAAT